MRGYAHRVSPLFSAKTQAHQGKSKNLSDRSHTGRTMAPMTNALPPLTKDLIDAFAASAVAWAVRLLGVLFAPRAVRRQRLLGRFVSRLERAVEAIIFLKAVRLMGPPPRPCARPRSAPRGFRRTRGSFYHLLKSARIRARSASLTDRIGRLFEALAHSGRYVAHYMKRLAAGLHFGGIIPCAPPAAPLTADAPRAV